MQHVPDAGAATLQFLGGAAIGSKYLLRAGESSVLFDCGLFQGLKALRLRNWEPFPIAPETIDAIVLSHAHIDHSGFLPVLARDGFKGPVYCTDGTRALITILLADSARLQEEDARFAARAGFSKHNPPLPLYTERDVETALSLCRVVPLQQEVSIARGIDLTMVGAGHILGAATTRIAAAATTVLFSGDLGGDDDLLALPPDAPPSADYIVIESTYGDTPVHAGAEEVGVIRDGIRRAAARGGVVLVPAFAVGRTQVLLQILATLREAGEIPRIPIYLDSPLGLAATRMLGAFIGQHRFTREMIDRIEHEVEFIETVAASKAIAGKIGPMVIVAGSGMASGGRILHHLKCFAADPRTLIMLTGYQAPGTRGAALRDGARSLRIHGGDHAIRAEVIQLSALSSHADADHLIKWLNQTGQPRLVKVAHGDAPASKALCERIAHELKLRCSLAVDGEILRLE